MRTFLFAYGAQYSSISWDTLCNMFGLEDNVVHSIASKMMINGQLHGSWDQPTRSIVLHKAEPSKLQALALQFADKVGMFVETNERLLDSKGGGYGYKDDFRPVYQGGQVR